MANDFTSFLKKSQNHAVSAMFVLIVLMLILPVPGQVLDFLMVLNIAASLIILLVVLYTPKSSNLTSFPRVILVTTIYGLALNICSTRFILVNGHLGFDAFQGNMIKQFSNIVAGSDIIVGMVIFFILIVIQTVVITKGATRVSEVAARFALDSMNSKMFAVDSELNSGSITDEQAREKKASIQRESDFYSAMDGSNKFVSGNVKAGIVITVVNLVVGIIVAMVKYDMAFRDAFNTFPRLTIGDGLLSQLPSLLLSVATGVLVTGSNSNEVLGDEIKKQFNVSGYVYVISGLVLCLISLIFRSSPFLIVLLLILGGAFIYLGYRMLQKEKITFQKELAKEEAKKAQSQTGQNPEEVSPVVPLDPLCLEIGVALIDLVQKEKGAELLERVKRIRREAALDLGLVVPRIRIIDNLTIDPQEYCFKIRGIETGRSRLKLGYYMCMNTGAVVEEIKGEPTRDPAFGMPAIWVGEEQRSDAERAGYSVVDPPTIIATHITEIIRSHAADILGRQEVSAIIDKIKETNPVVVNEVLETYKYTYGEIERILQGLLREQVSIRNIVQILETLANFGMYTPHNPEFLIEKVRESLGLQICLQYVDPQDKKLSVLQLSQSWSQKIAENTQQGQNGSPSFLAFGPVEGRQWISAVSGSCAALRERNIMPIILCPGEVRQVVKNSIEGDVPGVVVLSYNEVIAAGKNVQLDILGEISE